jgi:hypothetical protein
MPYRVTALPDQPPRITDEFLSSLDEEDRLACGRFAARMVIIALRTRSVELLAEALLADALSGGFESDWRETMCSQSVHYVVARELGLSPVALFDSIADRLPPGDLADQMRQFGRRSDITLAAFGHELVETPDGPDLIPAGIQGQLWREAQEPPASPPASKGELQTLGREVARRLGAIVARREASLIWSGRELTNSAGWGRELYNPTTTLPAKLIELPFLVSAKYTGQPPRRDMVTVTVALVDPYRRACAGVVGYSGCAHSDWTAQACGPWW